VAAIQPASLKWLHAGSQYYPAAPPECATAKLLQSWRGDGDGPSPGSRGSVAASGLQLHAQLLQCQSPRKRAFPLFNDLTFSPNTYLACWKPHLRHGPPRRVTSTRASSTNDACVDPRDNLLGCSSRWPPERAPWAPPLQIALVCSATPFSFVCIDSTNYAAKNQFMCFNLISI
jgi:hypothetical protein